MKVKRIWTIAALITAGTLGTQAQSLTDWTERVEKSGKSFPQE